jgi:ArsR family transcriptional regulator
MQLKALADETRMRIIQLLASGPLCACDLHASFDISQPTLSYHLKRQ